MQRIILILMLTYLPASATADEAQTAYNNHCRTCHSTKLGDNRLGPSLANIIGQEAGRVAGYRYSSAFQNAGFIWTRETMDAFLNHPDKAVPGNNMNPFQGINDPEIRALIIEVLSR